MLSSLHGAAGTQIFNEKLSNFNLQDLLLVECEGRRRASNRVDLGWFSESSYALSQETRAQFW